MRRITRQNWNFYREWLNMLDGMKWDTAIWSDCDNPKWIVKPMNKQPRKQPLTELYVIGQRVSMDPSTNLWSRGICHGTITSIGHKYLYIKFDDEPCLPRRILPDNLKEM